MTVRVHPFPSRTRQLSSLVPTILGWKRPGTIGRCQHKENTHGFPWVFFFVFTTYVSGRFQCRNYGVAPLAVQLAAAATRLRQVQTNAAALGWKRPGTIGRCQHKNRPHGFPCGLFFYLQLLMFPAASSAETTELCRLRRNSRPRQRDFDRYTLMPRRLAGSGLVR